MALATLVVAVSCKGKTSKFEVKGTMSNSGAKMIYLEEVPAVAANQRIVIDSAQLDKEGRFILHAEDVESKIYNLRLDQNTYPVAAVINDAPIVTVEAKFNSGTNEFADSYDIKGSASSQQMKDFMIRFNGGLQKIFQLTVKADSLKKAGTPDSLMIPMMEEHRVLAESLKNDFDKAIENSKNPALTLFILGYYQSTERNMSFGLPPIPQEEIEKIIDETAANYPEHQGVASIKAVLDREKQKQAQQAAFTWIGKQAPEIVLPDVNGKEVRLSSFKGKYVLVDFWASWCGPCRKDNPNVVNAFKKFGGKNFTILGVSLDRPGEKDEWLKAIRNDGLTWTHVSDLQWWYSPVVKLYGFDGIPYNVLVDPDGKVIAEKLHGQELEARLGEVLR